MTCLLQKRKLLNILKILVRYKSHSQHWSVLKKKKSSSQKALEHFNDFYKSIYGESWKNIRYALLMQEHKYVAVINNYSDTDRICQQLESLGAMNLKDIYNASVKNLEMQHIKIDIENLRNYSNFDKKLDNITVGKQMESSINPNSCDDPAINSKIIENKNKNDIFKPIKLSSITSDVKKVNSNVRIIKSSAGLSASQLYEFVPATKLKGMDDYVLESDHYRYYTSGSDFFIKVEKEDSIYFPDNLLIYTFEENNFTKFPKPQCGTTNALDYFVLDGASVLPVLALDLQLGDVLLDMCAAPGGKMLTALQTMLPQLIVANDIQSSRINKINNFVNELLLDFEDWDKKLIVTQSDARNIQDKGLYNKILVDVPCTTDRHVLHEDDNNIFKTTRIKERLQLPELQSEILTNALNLIVPGGTIVYSTCSLSPIQNDGVVQTALKKVFEESNIMFTVKDQTNALTPLKYLYNFGNFGLKYGHIVIPSKSKNWGPMYFCKMVRIQ